MDKQAELAAEKADLYRRLQALLDRADKVREEAIHAGLRHPLQPSNAR